MAHTAHSTHIIIATRVTYQGYFLDGQSTSEVLLVYPSISPFFFPQIGSSCQFPRYPSVFYLFPDPLKYQVQTLFFFLNLCKTSQSSLLAFYIRCKNIVNILAGSRLSRIHPFPLDSGIKIFCYCPNSLRNYIRPSSPTT